MMKIIRKKLNAVYHTQRNNIFKPFITCYSTSMATVIDFILTKEEKTKCTIGCPKNTQLDDFVYKQIYSKDTKKWIRKNAGRFGSWFLRVKPHTVAAIEVYVFNKLMKRLGYRAEFRQGQTFNDYKYLIDKYEIPQVLHGYFKPETRVKGHIIVGVGYDITEGVFICHDPYGNAKLEYKSVKGAYVHYPVNHWFMTKKTKPMWITAIIKI
jgi:hypothetical protein